VEFLSDRGVHLKSIQTADGFERIHLLDAALLALGVVEDATNALLINDETKRQYLLLADRVDRLFRAILPDLSANEFGLDRKAIVVIAEKIRSLAPIADISEIMDAVKELLDWSIAPKGYKIGEVSKVVDLSLVDFEALKKQFEQGRKRIEIEKLRGMINSNLQVLVRLNKTRMNFYEQFQQMIDEYNKGAKNADEFFVQLVAFARSLNEEEQRGVAEQLSEQELAIFDILTRPEIKLSRKEKEQVKKVAKDLLNTLIAERLVLDWRKRQQTRAAVELTIQKVFEELPPVFNQDQYKQKCGLTYQHVYENYYGEGKSVYARLNAL